MGMHKVLRTLVLSDLFILSSFGLIQPIFAIFLLGNMHDATIASVGIAATIQLFTKALLQMPVAKWADDERGNCRELYALLAGSLLVSIVPLGFIFSTSMGHIYIVQFLYGTGQALTFPSWRVIFTRYTNQDRTGFEWGLYDTIVSFGTASAAALGGFLAQKYSFTYLFIFVSIMSFLGTAFLTHIFQQEFSCRIKLRKN